MDGAYRYQKNNFRGNGFNTKKPKPRNAKKTPPQTRHQAHSGPSTVEGKPPSSRTHKIAPPDINNLCFALKLYFQAHQDNQKVREFLASNKASGSLDSIIEKFEMHVIGDSPHGALAKKIDVLITALAKPNDPILEIYKTIPKNPPAKGDRRLPEMHMDPSLNTESITREMRVRFVGSLLEAKLQNKQFDTGITNVRCNAPIIDKGTVKDEPYIANKVSDTGCRFQHYELPDVIQSSELLKIHMANLRNMIEVNQMRVGSIDLFVGDKSDEFCMIYHSRRLRRASEKKEESENSSANKDTSEFSELSFIWLSPKLASRYSNPLNKYYAIARYWMEGEERSCTLKSICPRRSFTARAKVQYHFSKMDTPTEAPQIKKKRMRIESFTEPSKRKNETELKEKTVGTTEPMLVRSKSL